MGAGQLAIHSVISDGRA